MSSVNPPTGRRQVPVTNCNSRIRFSLSISLTTYEKNTAGEWDPRDPQARSPAEPWAPSCSTAPATTPRTLQPGGLGHSPGQRCRILGDERIPRGLRGAALPGLALLQSRF